MTHFIDRRLNPKGKSLGNRQRFLKRARVQIREAVQKSLKDAAVEGGKLRFRPIQMTSFAFIAGLLPLVVATGAGAIGNRTIGTTGAGGMLVGTVIGVLIIPGLYYLFGKLADGRKILNDEVDEPLSEIFEHNKPSGSKGSGVINAPGGNNANNGH